MKGQNIIKMNTATMQEAIAYYLNNVVLKVPVDVQKVVQGDDYGANEFIVTTVEKTTGDDNAKTL